MNLYLLSQSVNSGWDTYNSCVVAAQTEDKARNTFPSPHYDSWENCKHSWASSPDQVVVELLGKAKLGTKAGIICSSFNAG